MRLATSTIALVWDNFGPMHIDRCEAVVEHFGARVRLVGIEIHAQSSTYAWRPETSAQVEKVTLAREGETLGTWAMARRLIGAIRRERVTHLFLCNYDNPAILIAAWFGRLTGRKVFVMGCSKFDDYPRKLWREAGKRLFFLPYQGGISSGIRARDYQRFLGVPEERIVGEYNTLSIARIRSLAGAPPAPDGTPFAERHFAIVARLVPKKNVAAALTAYRLYRDRAAKPRDLHIYGNGPLEGALRSQADRLDISEHVHFHGFVQTDGVSRALANALALLLPSVEEQFGNVAIEAQALGVPVILSENCGARDTLIQSGENGFVIQPDRPEGMANFMLLLGEDEARWRRACEASVKYAPRNDAPRFAEAVEQLVG